MNDKVRFFSKRPIKKANRTPKHSVDAIQDLLNVSDEFEFQKKRIKQTEYGSWINHEKRKKSSKTKDKSRFRPRQSFFFKKLVITSPKSPVHVKKSIHPEILLGHKLKSRVLDSSNLSYLVPSYANRRSTERPQHSAPARRAKSQSLRKVDPFYFSMFAEYRGECNRRWMSKSFDQKLKKPKTRNILVKRLEFVNNRIEKNVVGKINENGSGWRGRQSLEDGFLDVSGRGIHF